MIGRKVECLSRVWDFRYPGRKAFVERGTIGTVRDVRDEERQRVLRVDFEGREGRVVALLNESAVRFV